MSASELDVDLGLAPELHHRASLAVVADTLVPASEPRRYHGWTRHIKRATDIVIALAVLPLAVPVMVVIAIFIRRGSPGPALFRQERVGQNGNVFRILKFRTMFVDSEERLRAD